jgi:transcriptional regulator with XRE-family HTH domain
LGGVPVKAVGKWEVVGRQALGRRLRELRIESGLRYFDVCHRANIQPTTLNYLEKGERTPSFGVLQRIARVYGADPVKLAALLLKPPEDTRPKISGQGRTLP